MNRKSDLKILVINCGSSSVKFQLINMSNEKALAGGIVERLGLPQSLIKFKFDDKDFTKECNSLDHSSAISEIIDAVTNGQSGVISDKSEISAVGGVLLIGLGINILEIKKLRILNMLPSLIIIIILVYLFT